MIFTMRCGMNRAFFKYKIFALIIFCFSANAQSYSGFTIVPDTSYSNWSAYLNSKKTNPETKWPGEFKFKNVQESRNIVYQVLSGKSLSLDAFYDSSIKKKPAIVIIHGGGWRSGNRSQHIPLAQKLASIGYASFTVEYRLSTEALFPAAVYDIKESIKWVKAHSGEFGLDTNKIAVCGFSAGGQLAALIGNTNKNPFFELETSVFSTSSAVQAIIDLDGILAFIHPESGEGDDSNRPSAATLWFGYSKTENPDLWKKGSALTYAGEKSPSTLFINSSVARMHAGREDYCAILKKSGIYTEIRTFQDAPHSFVQFEPWFSPMVTTIDNFLKKVFRK